MPGTEARRTAEDDEQVAEHSEHREHEERDHEEVEASVRRLRARLVPCRRTPVVSPLGSRRTEREGVSGRADSCEPGGHGHEVEVLLGAVLGDEREHGLWALRCRRRVQ